MSHKIDIYSFVSAMQRRIIIELRVRQSSPGMTTALHRFLLSIDLLTMIAPDPLLSESGQTRCLKFLFMIR